jgi:hypothetical protein
VQRTAAALPLNGISSIPSPHLRYRCSHLQGGHSHHGHLPQFALPYATGVAAPIRLRNFPNGKARFIVSFKNFDCFPAGRVTKIAVKDASANARHPHKSICFNTTCDDMRSVRKSSLFYFSLNRRK